MGSSPSNSPTTRFPASLPITELAVSAYRIPTEAPESDGTYEWESTTMVVVEAGAGGKRALGYTYADKATAVLIQEKFPALVLGRDAMDVESCWQALFGSVRNIGRPGISAMAISAVDIALWNLKACLLGLPLVKLLGPVRERLPVYASGGFTSLDCEELQEQLGHWAAQGMHAVKMKVGRHPGQDLARIRAARQAIKPETALFIDANGAYSCKQALHIAREVLCFDVTWFEEPVPANHLDDLRLLRKEVPAPMEVVAGEYCYESSDFHRLLRARAVDVIQADVTRCGGITGFLHAAVLAGTYGIPMSSHCAPALHVHLGCAVGPMRHAEYFHDHSRIEQMLLDSPPIPRNGAVSPDLSRPGMGLHLKGPDAERFRIF